MDLRGGIDALVAACRRKIAEDPLSGAVFAFTNRRRTLVKILNYDGQGFLLLSKRLSEGRFRHWPRRKSAQAPRGPGGAGLPPKLRLTAVQLLVLFRGGNPHLSSLETGEWRPLLDE